MSFSLPVAAQQNEATIRELLNEAHGALANQHPVKALNTVIQTVSTMGAQPVVQQILDRMRQELLSGQPKDHIQELCALFTQVGMGAEMAMPSSQTHEQDMYSNQMMDMPMEGCSSPGDASLLSMVGNGKPILEETGRLGIAACAMQDGSSYVCPLCGGCVNINRRLQHEQLWCQP